MFRNAFKITLRNILRQKAYSFINIMGLSIGMACCILIMLYITDELSYDKFHTNSDRIYRVTREWFNQDGSSSLHLSRVAPPIGPLLENDFPQIVQDVVRIGEDDQTFLKVDDKVFIEEGFFWADESFFNIFSCNFIHGNYRTALTEPNSVVLTRSMSMKIFGTEDALGKYINYERERDLKVTGIIEDVPHNTHFKFDLLGSFKTLYSINGEEFFKTNWGNNSYFTYILLPENFPVAELESQIPSFIDKHLSEIIYNRTGQMPADRPSKTTRLTLQKLTDIHLTSHLDMEAEENGSLTNIYMFGVIALLILLIACINFMNLATARSSKRAREIGVRKVLGAYRHQLIKQFLGESVLFALIALVIAVVLVETALPYFNAFTDKQLRVEYTGNYQILLAFLVITIFVGIISGSYPAFLLSSFKPVSVLKTKTVAGGSNKSRFRTVLVVLQFSISIALMIAMGVVYDQMSYVKDKKLGYDKNQVVLLPSSPLISENIESFKDQLLQNKNVVSVTTSVLVPTNALLNDWGAGIIDGDKPLPLGFRLAVIQGDHDFLNTYGIKLIAGRNFSRAYSTDDSSAFILNETAVRQIGWSPHECVGKELQYGKKRGRVIGVAEDFHFESLHNAIVPVIILIDEGGQQVSVKIAGAKIQSTLDFLKTKWAEYRPEYPFTYSFLDQEYEALYRSEQQLGKIFGVFSILAVIIACLGLFGLASFAVEQRTKEIGVRKVMGASANGIIFLFSKEFLKLILISILISFPAAYYIMNNWLNEFAYRTTLNPGTFIFAGTLAIVIALTTVIFQAFKAASANPIDSLRTE